MKKQTRNLLIAGIAIAMIISILSPFIASTNPDGLEKSSEMIGSGSESGIYTAPFADYSVSALGDGPLAGIVALVIGSFMALAVALVYSYILRRRKEDARNKEDIQRKEDAHN